ncbi:MAG TPA: FliA/WhiG family RNA polymerase sigma factor [Bryobacteraceae bacterium]|nr:FliA/WhiG family RNA polymerase sigma factor [Bryobacteraceae bacterium]
MTLSPTGTEQPVAATVIERTMRDQMVVEHLPLVKAIAIRVHENLPVHVDLDDLIHAGVLGLIDAIAKYRAEKNVAFSSYAKHRIKGAILDSLRELDWASRDMRRRQKQLEAMTYALSVELQRDPTEAELAARMGVGVDRWRRIASEMQCAGLVSSSTRKPDDEELPVPEYPAGADTRPDQMCSLGQLREMLLAAMDTLPDRYRQVVFLYYTKDKTMREIGRGMGINESRVSQIHKSALERMAEVLSAAGIHSSDAF